jgi:hypothetical protein
MYELNRFHMESEIALKTLQLNGVEGDVRSHVSVLTLRLEDMMREKCAAEDALRKEKQATAESHREQAKKASELAQAQRWVNVQQHVCVSVRVCVSYLCQSVVSKIIACDNTTA